MGDVAPVSNIAHAGSVGVGVEYAGIPSQGNLFTEWCCAMTIMHFDCSDCALTKDHGEPLHTPPGLPVSHCLPTHHSAAYMCLQGQAGSCHVLKTNLSRKVIHSQHCDGSAYSEKGACSSCKQPQFLQRPPCMFRTHQVQHSQS